MNEEQIRELAKETFAENIMNNLDSSIVFKYIQELEQENQKYKEVTDKLSKLIYKIDDLRKHTGGYPTHYMDDLVDILKEVEHE